MSKHLFKIGDLVRLPHGSHTRPNEVFKIVRLRPGDREDLPPAYHVKAVSEGHERVVKEDELSPA